MWKDLAKIGGKIIVKGTASVATGAGMAVVMGVTSHISQNVTANKKLTKEAFKGIKFTLDELL